MKESEKTIRFLQDVILALPACDLKLVNHFHGKIESRIDKDFGNDENLVKEQYLRTISAIKKRKNELT